MIGRNEKQPVQPPYRVAHLGLFFFLPSLYLRHPPIRRLALPFMYPSSFASFSFRGFGTTAARDVFPFATLRRLGRRGNGEGTSLCLSSRQMSSAASSSSPSSSPLVSVFSTYCVLCDAPFDNWVAHTELPSHAARVAISEAFVKPERSQSMLSQLQEHIAVDFSVIEEATQLKVQRRKRRLRSSLQYLVQEGVIQYCLPILNYPPSEWTDEPKHHGVNASSSVSSYIDGPTSTNTSPLPPSSCWNIREENKLLNAAMVGQAYIEEALTDRVARLAPRTKGPEIYAIVRYLCGMRQWSKLYDLLELCTVLCPAEYRCSVSSFHTNPSHRAAPAPLSGSSSAPRGTEVRAPSSSATVAHHKDTPSRPPCPRLTQAEKALLLWSCMGELRLIEERDRSHKVEHKAITEQLVHHVLVSHCLDNMVSELLHHALEKVVEECTPVWRIFQQQEAYMRLRAYQSRPPALSPFPVPTKKECLPANESTALHDTTPSMTRDLSSQHEKRGKGRDVKERGTPKGVVDSVMKGTYPFLFHTPSPRDAELLGLFFSPWKEYDIRHGGIKVEKEDDPKGGPEARSGEGSSSQDFHLRGAATGNQTESSGKDPWQEGDHHLTEKKKSTLSTSSFSFPTEKNGSVSRTGAGNIGSTRWMWQEVSRQLVYERPVVPMETPSATFAPFYPRLYPASSSFTSKES